MYNYLMVKTLSLRRMEQNYVMKTVQLWAINIIT